MKRSDTRILNTHTGSLPRPPDLVEALNAKELGKAYDQAALDKHVQRAIAEIVQRQAETGLDIINDGEHSKVSWMAYARARLSGLEEIDVPCASAAPRVTLWLSRRPTKTCGSCWPRAHPP